MYEVTDFFFLYNDNGEQFLSVLCSQDCSLSFAHQCEIIWPYSLCGISSALQTVCLDSAVQSTFREQSQSNSRRPFAQVCGVPLELQQWLLALPGDKDQALCRPRARSACCREVVVFLRMFCHRRPWCELRCLAAAKAYLNNSFLQHCENCVSRWRVVVLSEVYMCCHMRCEVGSFLCWGRQVSWLFCLSACML